jgi:serine phosphatase RsbU (regulator of sigma subunit)
MESQQKIRPLGLRAKILGIIAVSVVIPLVAGTMVTRFMGFRAYRKEKGSLFQTLAVHYARKINGVLDAHARSIQGWVTLSSLAQDVAELSQGPAPETEELAEDIKYWDEQWPGPLESLETIQVFLTNAVSDQIRSFQALHPQFVEILVTDAEGRLVGASGRTDDYWQADESWWHNAIRLRGKQVWLEGIHLDESAGVNSIDMAVALYAPDRPSLHIGVVKAVLEAAPVIGSLNPLLGQEQPASQVVQTDGEILVNLFERSREPEEQTVRAEALEKMRRQGQGWDVMSLTSETEELVGFASLKQTRMFVDRFMPTGLDPMYVTVHEDLGKILGPFHRQIRILSSVGGLLVLLFGLIGVLAATRQIISPLQVLRAAANSISATARLSDDEEEGSAPDARSESEARDMVERVGRIATGDEIEDLAIEFQRMADRVLNYHVQLQHELTEKAEELQRDLAIAREFQESLLPKTYPEVPAAGVDAPLRLSFAHRYRAALSVGGDFFYVTRLADHRVAVFITDVMGHGARSALVTAILRTLLHHLDPEFNDAGSIMAYINRQFCESIPHGKQFIFATAFCLVLDTKTQEATCASAGHPPALRTNPSHREVVPVLTNREVGPALGLSETSAYPAQLLKLEPGDSFLLYTDGLLEAPDLRNENFGEQRLRDVASTHRDEEADAVCEAVMHAVARHMDTVVTPDDLCLAVIKVDAHAK